MTVVKIKTESKPKNVKTHNGGPKNNGQYSNENVIAGGKKQ